MDNNKITTLRDSFDSILHVFPDANIEYWYARDLMGNLGYVKWQNFKEVINRAKVACLNSKIPIDNHFTDVSKMVPIGSGVERPVEDIILTRYACYLIAENGDPRKDEIAFAQTYFALQTRKQELVEERLRLQERIKARKKLTSAETELSKNIYERGVDEKGFARIRSKGDMALFGGNTTKDMKSKLSAPENRPLADFLPTVTIAAKNLATEMSNHNINEQDLQGEKDITGEHVQNNESVRDMLESRGIRPEDLPPEEDIKKLERRVKRDEKKMIKESELPKKGEA